MSKVFFWGGERGQREEVSQVVVVTEIDWSGHSPIDLQFLGEFILLVLDGGLDGFEKILKTD